MHQNGIDKDNCTQLHTTHSQRLAFQPLLEHLFPNTSPPRHLDYHLASLRFPCHLPPSPLKKTFFQFSVVAAPCFQRSISVYIKMGQFMLQYQTIPKSQWLNICKGPFLVQLHVYSVVKRCFFFLAIQGKCMTRDPARHKLLKLILGGKRVPFIVSQ